MSELTDLQSRALEVLKRHTRRAPITGAEIMQNIGMAEKDRKKPGAKMRQVIHALRVKGYPVCATGNGYWYARTETELSKYIAEFENRILMQQEALGGLKSSYKELVFPQDVPAGSPIIVER